MTSLPLRFLPALLVVMLALSTTSYGQLSSTVAQSGANDRAPGPLVNTNGASGMGDSVAITGTTNLTDVTNPAANPFTFDAAAVAALTSINSIQITLTIFNGDTGIGEFDRNNLTLALDGFDTGLKLNGFDSVSGNDVTLTLMSISITNGPQILAALKADNMLMGTILDATGAVDSNGMELSSTFNTTLIINVPEPGTSALVAIGVIAIGIGAWRGRPKTSRV